MQALLYLDHEEVTRALLEAVETRGPRDRMMHLLITRLRADVEQVALLLQDWLADPNEKARFAAMEGLSLARIRKKDLLSFPKMEAMLKDPSGRVRLRAVAVVGSYQNAAALKAVRPFVNDEDAAVYRQAMNAVGWVAVAAARGSKEREEAVELLRAAVQSKHPAAQQAAYWLAKVEAE